MRSAVDNTTRRVEIVRRRREGRTRLTLYCPAAGDHGLFLFSKISEVKRLFEYFLTEDGNSSNRKARQTG